MVERFVEGDMENYRVGGEFSNISPYSELSSALLHTSGMNIPIGIPEIHESW